MKTGKIPYPGPGEERRGNHALLAVGYDDNLKIRNRRPKGPVTVGALRIQNSWSEEWGEKGFGWVPYEFVSKGRAQDFWTLIKADWIAPASFRFRSRRSMIGSTLSHYRILEKLGAGGNG